MKGPSNRKLATIYFLIALGGFILGLVKAVPIFLSLLQGSEVVIREVLPWLILSWFILLIGGGLLLRLRLREEKERRINEDP